MKGKLLMICVMQLILFGKLLASLKLFFFVINPTTWFSIRRADPGDIREIGSPFFAMLYRPAILIAPCVVALCMKFAVDYNLAVDSMSIILSSQDVKDCIFDGVAITFISDLSIYWFACCASVYHLDSFDDFECVLALPDEMARFKAEQPIMMKILDTLRCGEGSILHRGYGARRLETVCAFTIVVIIYVRQFFVLLQSLDTDVLPVARDVCTLWRWDAGKDPYFKKVGAIFGFLAHYVLIGDVEEALDHRADPEGDGYCTDDYRRLLIADMWELSQKYPSYTWGFIALLVVFIVMPQIFHTFSARINSYFIPPGLMENQKAKRMRSKQGAVS
jgi:hypothetical protein